MEPLRRFNTAPVDPKKSATLSLSGGRMLPLEHRFCYRNPDGTFDKTRFPNGALNPAYASKQIDPANGAFAISVPDDKTINPDNVHGERAPDKVC